MAKSPINEQHSSADLVTVKKNFNLTFLIISLQGSRLTFQLASPVASDRFDSLAKTNYTSGAKFKEHCFSISRDILD